MPRLTVIIDTQTNAVINVVDERVRDMEEATHTAFEFKPPRDRTALDMLLNPANFSAMSIDDIGRLVLDPETFGDECCINFADSNRKVYKKAERQVSRKNIIPHQVR